VKEQAVKIDLKNRQKVLTIAAALVVGLLIGDSLVVSPLLSSWKDRQERIKTLEQSVSRGDTLLKQEQNLRTRWTNYKNGALPANMPEAEQEIYNAVDRWATLSRASVSDYSTLWRASNDKSSTDQDYMTLECKANAAGSMEAITRFLYQLEKDPLAIRIEELDLVPKDATGRQLTLAIRFTGLLLTTTQK
jgi:hypothetical protein